MDRRVFVAALLASTGAASAFAQPRLLDSLTQGDASRGVRDALGRKRKITVVHNPDYAQGLSTSLARGLAAVPESADGALVCLGDMPRIKAQHLDRLIDAFNPVEGRAICVPTYEGKRGNPVLFARRFFREMATIAGDVGARHLIGEHGELVAEVEIGDEGVLIDVDSPDALVALKAKMGRTPS